jgi:protein O-mannosyl-transferase
VTRSWWESPFKSLRSAAVLAAALAALGSANSLGNGFAYDDRPIIELNTRIHTADSIPASLVSPYWPNEYGRELGLWRPVVTGLYGGLWISSGGSPAAFHLANVLVHVWVTVLVVLLVGYLAPLSVAFLSGLLFAVHPVHTEAIANAVGMAELLSSALYLWASLLFVRGVEPGGSVPRKTLLGITVLYAFAFLSKESAITLPGALFLLDGLRRERRTLSDVPSLLRKQGPLYAALAGVAALVLLGRQQILGSIASPMAPLGVELLNEGVPRIFTVTSAWPHYFRLLFFPSDLSPDYSPAVIPLTYGWNATNVLGVVVALSALVLALLAWRTGALSRERITARAAAFGVVWFVVTISPISNILFLSGVILAERTLYLPSVGFVVGTAWLLVEFYRERARVAVATTVLILGAMTWKTVDRNPVWMDNIGVFDDMMANHPESGRAQWLLADASRMVGNIDQSNRAYAVSISLLNGSYPLLIDAGKHLITYDREAAGIFILERAWRDRPDRGIAPQVLSIMYYRRERYEDAARAAQAAVDYYEGKDGASTHMLAESLAKLGRWDEAIEARLMAIYESGEGHRWQQWTWLADAYVSVGDTAKALMALDSATVRAEDGDANGREGASRIDSIRAVLTGS